MTKLDVTSLEDKVSPFPPSVRPKQRDRGVHWLLSRWLAKETKTTIRHICTCDVSSWSLQRFSGSYPPPPPPRQKNPPMSTRNFTLLRTILIKITSIFVTFHLYIAYARCLHNCVRASQANAVSHARWGTDNNNPAYPFSVEACFQSRAVPVEYQMKPLLC